MRERRHWITSLENFLVEEAGHDRFTSVFVRRDERGVIQVRPSNKADVVREYWDGLNFYEYKMAEVREMLDQMNPF